LTYIPKRSPESIELVQMESEQFSVAAEAPLIDATPVKPLETLHEKNSEPPIKSDIPLDVLCNFKCSLYKTLIIHAMVIAFGYGFMHGTSPALFRGFLAAAEISIIFILVFVVGTTLMKTFVTRAQHLKTD